MGHTVSKHILQILMTELFSSYTVIFYSSWIYSDSNGSYPVQHDAGNTHHLPKAWAQYLLNTLELSYAFSMGKSELKG